MTTTTTFTSEGHEDLKERYIEACKSWNQAYEDLRIWCLQNNYEDSMMVYNLQWNPNYYPQIAEATTFGIAAENLKQVRNTCRQAGVDIVMCLKELQMVADSTNLKPLTGYDVVIAREIKSEMKINAKRKRR